MACCAVDGEKTVDEEISDDNRRKKSSVVLGSDVESRQSRGATPSRKTFASERVPPAATPTTTTTTTTAAAKDKDKDKSLLMISDGELESLLQEASNPLYLKSSNNPLLQKVIDETNFDEPYLGTSSASVVGSGGGVGGGNHALGKFPPIYKESRRHLERRLRQDAASCMASTSTTQGGSLQNLSRMTTTTAKHSTVDFAKSKSLRKSGSLNTFPAGSDDTQELAELKSLLASCITQKPSCGTVDDHHRPASSSTSTSMGHRRNRSSSECQSAVIETEAPQPASAAQRHRKRSAGMSLDSTTADSSSAVAVHTELHPQPPPVVDDDGVGIVATAAAGTDDAIGEIEMMDIDHQSSEEATSRGETLPLLVKGAEDVTWSSASSCVQRAFVEVSAPRKVHEEADDKVGFPLALTKLSDLQTNGQIYLDSSTYRPSLSNKGFHSNGLIFPMNERRTAVSGFLESISADATASDGHARHTTETAADVLRIEDLRSSGYQRSLDENGNPFYAHDSGGGGGGTYRNGSTGFLHHEAGSNRAGGRKPKKTRQSGRQREMLAEHIEGHFGSLDIEVILKRINDSEDDGVDAITGGNVGGGGGGGGNAARSAKRTLNKDKEGYGNNVVGKNSKTKKVIGNNNNNNNSNSSNNNNNDDNAAVIKPNVLENGLGNSKDDGESSASPIDSDEHAERSSRSWRLRKQEFMKKNVGSSSSSNENGAIVVTVSAPAALTLAATAGRRSGSLDGHAGSRDDRSPEPTATNFAAGRSRSTRPLTADIEGDAARSVGRIDSTAATELGNEPSSFVNDFYSTNVLMTGAEEPEFHEVRKKKRRRQRSSFRPTSSSSSSFKGGDFGASKMAGRDVDQGSRDDFRIRRTPMQTSSNHSPPAMTTPTPPSSTAAAVGTTTMMTTSTSVAPDGNDGESLHASETMLWPDLPHHHHLHHHGLRGNPFSADDVRRKSMGSVPPSEHSSGGDSDIESVHSLPVGRTTPKAAVGKTSSSSSCTPQASYADIAKMSGCGSVASDARSSRRTISASPAVATTAALTTTTATSNPVNHRRPPATATKPSSLPSTSVDAKRDVATCTTADLVMAAQCGGDDGRPVMPTSTSTTTTSSSVSMTPTDLTSSTLSGDESRLDPEIGCCSGEASPNINPAPPTAATVDAINVFGVSALSTTLSTSPVATTTTSPIAVTPTMSLTATVMSSTRTTTDTTMATTTSSTTTTAMSTSSTKRMTTGNNSSRSSRPAVQGTASASTVKFSPSSTTTRNRPVVVFASDLASPLELAEVTFGFDINERLLADLDLGRRHSQQQPQQQQQQQVQATVAAAAAAVTTVRQQAVSVAGSALAVRPETCDEEDDSIVSTGRIVAVVHDDDDNGDEEDDDVDVVDDNADTAIATTAKAAGTAVAVTAVSRTVDIAADDDETCAFNYRNVVDYIGIAWSGVKREIERELDGSRGGTSTSMSSSSSAAVPPKVHYYERR